MGSLVFGDVMNMNVFCKRAGVFAACLLFGTLFSVTACDQLMGDSVSGGDGEPSGAQTRIGEYILVRGDDSGNDVLRQVLNLKHAIDEQFEVDTLSSTDWAVDAGEGSKGQREILVGVTNREESIAANEELDGVYGYVIRSVGDKIVITASTTGLLEEAVNRFTEKYVKGSDDGVIPSDIDIRHTAKLPLCVMSEPSSMKLFISEKASPVLSLALSQFADRVRELSGIQPEIFRDMHMDPETVVAMFENSVFSEQKSYPAGLPEATGQDGWSMSREENKITLKGSSPLQTVAALSGLYQQLTDRTDRTLDGHTILYYEKESVHRESWAGACVRLVGAAYLGTESISGNSRCSYYERVSLNAYCAWQLLMADEGYGAFTVKDSSVSTATYLSIDGKTEVTAYYNANDRTLSVVETVR